MQRHICGSPRFDLISIEERGSREGTEAQRFFLGFAPLRLCVSRFLSPFRGNLLAAEGFDDLFGVADLADAQAEVLADFHGFAQGDDDVVDQQFQRLVAAL